MKNTKKRMKQLICFLLIGCMLFATSCAAKTNDSNDESTYETHASYELLEEVGLQVLENDNDTLSYISQKENCEINCNKTTGEMTYTDEDGVFSLELLDVDDDGVIYWQIQKEDEIITGEINTSESPEAQSVLVIGGTVVTVSAILTAFIKAYAVVTIAGLTFYAVDKALDTIKRNASYYNYFPAFRMFSRVFVAATAGLSQRTAVKWIKNGWSVWASNWSYAQDACIMASPIGVAEWGLHGSSSKGYYEHYHAVKYFEKNGRYVHTGAHCWYI